MHIFHLRPMALSCILFALALLAVVLLPPGIGILAGLLLSLLCILLICLRKGPALFPMYIGAMALACFLSLSFTLPLSRAETMVGRSVTVEGYVTDVQDTTAYSGRYSVMLRSVDGKRVRMGAQLVTEYAADLAVGDRFTATVDARAFDGAGDYNEEIYRYSQGEMLSLSCPEADLCTVTGQEEHPRVWMYRLNQRLSHRLYTRVGGEEGAFCAALLWGDRSFLEPYTSLTFRRTGTSHLLALSGLHVSILIALLNFLMKLLRIPRVVKAFLVPLAGLGYLFVTGMSPSTCRAVVMVCIGYLAMVLWRPSDPFTVISETLALLLILSPTGVLDLSLWMSFLAAAAVILCTDPLERLFQRWHTPDQRRKKRIILLEKLISAVGVGIAANLALLLLTACVWGQLALWSVPMTLLLSLPITLLLYLSVFTVLLPPLAPLSRIVAGGILRIIQWASEGEGILLAVGSSSSILILLLFSAVLLGAVVGKRRCLRLLWTVPLLLLAVLFSAKLPMHLPQKELSVSLQHSYGGEMAVISCGGRAAAIDLANGTAGQAGSVYREVLRAECTQLDELILTRYYSRSPFLVYSLASRIRIGCLRLPPPLNENERSIARRLEEEAARYGISVRYDTKDLQVPGMEVLMAEHTPLGTDSSVTVFSFRGGEEVMTLLNGGILQSEYREEVLNLIQDSHTLLICKRARGEEILPLTPATQRLILGDEALADRYPRRGDEEAYVILYERCTFMLE